MSDTFKIKRMIGAAMVCAVFLLSFFLAPLGNNIAKAAGFGIVVVDPGHLYYNNGATAPDGTTEAEVNRQLALKLVPELVSRGYTVYTTVNIGAGVPHLMDGGDYGVSARAAAANAAKADLFVSMHHDSAGAGWNTARGYTVLWTSRQAASSGRSHELAQFVYNSVRTLGYTVGNRSGGVIMQDVNTTVLMNNNCPAVTLEAGFMNNQSDLGLAKDPTCQAQVAQKVADGIDAFFTKYPVVDPNDKTGPTMGKLEVDEKSPTQKANFVLRAVNVKDKSGVKAVKFRVWHNASGSSSIVTYNGVAKGDGTWEALFKLSDFKNKTGLYKIIAYGTDFGNNTSNMGNTSFVMMEDNDPPTMSKLVFAETSPTKSASFVIQANNVTDPSGVKNVRFRIWNKKTGSESAKTLQGVKKEGTDDWEVVFRLADFKNDPGEYRVNVYATDDRGNSVLMGSGGIEVLRDKDAPTLKNILFGEQSPTDKQSFAIRAKGVADDSGVASVKFRVWHSALGTSSVRSYNGIDVGGGDYDMLVNLRDFKNMPGKLNVAVYATDKVGNTGKIGSGSIMIADTIDHAQPTMNKVSFSVESPATANTFKISATGVSDPSGVENVKFRVWNSADGEDKYKTYTGKSRGNGNYEMSFKLTDFQNRTGTYKVKAFGTDKMGNSGFMGEGSIKITGDTSPPYMKKLVLGEVSPTYATSFVMQANNVTDPAGVKEVKFRVKHAASGKVKTFAGKAKGSNNYEGEFKLSSFGGATGLFEIYVYGTDNKGNKGVIGSGSITVNKPYGITPIAGGPQATVEQMVNFFKSSGYVYPSYYEEAPRNTSLQAFAQLYYDICLSEGIRPEVAWAQMCLETKFLNFGNLVQKEQFNFAGLGATGPGFPGFDFAAEYGNNSTGIRYGVIGQVQHLKCYANSALVAYVRNDGKPVDPRWNESLRSTAPTVEMLAGKWATGTDYGIKVIDYINGILSAPAKMEAEEVEMLADMEGVIEQTVEGGGGAAPDEGDIIVEDQPPEPEGQPPAGEPEQQQDQPPDIPIPEDPVVGEPEPVAVDVPLEE